MDTPSLYVIIDTWLLLPWTFCLATFLIVIPLVSCSSRGSFCHLVAGSSTTLSISLPVCESPMSASCYLLLFSVHLRTARDGDHIGAALRLGQMASTHIAGRVKLSPRRDSRNITAAKRKFDTRAQAFQAFLAAQLPRKMVGDGYQWSRPPTHPRLLDDREGKFGAYMVLRIVR